MSEIVRSSLHDSFQESKKDAQLILEAEDEKALLEIIKQDKYIDWNELKEKHNLK